MKPSLGYAGQQLEPDLRRANWIGTVAPPPPTMTPELTFLIERAIEGPIGSPPLRCLVGPGTRIAVLFDDGSRPTPVRQIFPVVERALLQAGVKPEHIHPFHAPGLHRLPAHYLEAKAECLLAHPNVASHDYQNSHTVFRGVTSRGTPVFVNDIVDRVDLVASIGNITPHMDAGYGGGAKIILPGICAKPTVEQNHSYFTSPMSRMRIVQGNPVREDMDEAGRLAGLGFIVNTVLDAHGKVADVVAGDAVVAHRRGVERKEEVCGYPLQEPADIAVVASEARWLSHAMGAMMLAELAVRPGGSIVLAAPCTEGWSPTDVLEAGITAPLDYLRLTQGELAWMVANRGAPEIRQSGAIFDYRRVMAEKHVYLANERFSRADVESFGMVWAGGIQEGYDAALERCGSGARVALFPQAGKMIPIVRHGQAHPVAAQQVAVRQGS